MSPDAKRYWITILTAFEVSMVLYACSPQTQQDLAIPIIISACVDLDSDNVCTSDDGAIPGVPLKLNGQETYTDKNGQIFAVMEMTVPPGTTAEDVLDIVGIQYKNSSGGYIVELEMTNTVTGETSDVTACAQKPQAYITMSNPTLKDLEENGVFVDMPFQICDPQPSPPSQNPIGSPSHNHQH